MALIFFVFISGIFLILYIIKITVFFLAIRNRSSNEVAGGEIGQLKVTLLVPFRNEAENLPQLILDTQVQHYPKDLFEVLLINDHSEDESAAIVEKLAQNAENIKMIHLPGHLQGKKAAISRGVAAASGDWIIQTDADCRLQRGFIGAHVRVALKDRNCFISGPVQLEGRDELWSQLEILEFLSLTGVTMGSFLSGRPVMCNGANLSYSKAFYDGNERELSRIASPSGDDMFLLIQAKKKALKMEYLSGPEAVVVTPATGSFHAFMQQRIRWGSKARLYKDFDIIYLASITFLINASILGFLIAGIIDSSILSIFGIILLLKSLSDLLLLWATARHFRKQRLLWYFPLEALFYYFYLVIAGILSLVSRYKWKGRKY